jgi:hypothetical protein
MWPLYLIQAKTRLSWNGLIQVLNIFNSKILPDVKTQEWCQTTGQS